MLWPQASAPTREDYAIRRERITRRLREAAQRRVALLLAPEGFGKSTALTHFLEDGSTPSVHYRAAPGTASLAAFLRGLAEASTAIVPGMRQSFPIAHERAMRAESPASVFVPWLIEHTAGRSLIVALDDLHYVSGEEVTRFLIQSIEAAGGGIAWILADRGKRFVVPRWLATGISDLPIDETELTFVPQDIADLARSLGCAAAPGDFLKLQAATAGRASAVRLALAAPQRRASTSFDDLALCDELGRRLLLNLLNPSFFIRAAVFDEVDLAMLQRAGWQDASLDLNVLQRAGLLEPIADDRYRWESGFHEIVLRELRNRGDAAVCDAMLADVDDRDAALRILKRHGLTLLDTGNSDVVRACMERFVGADPRGAALTGISAALEAQIGHYDTADAWYRQAVASAGNIEVKIALVYRWSLGLLRRGKSECVELLERYAEISSSLKGALHATLAAAYTMMDRLDDARRWAWRARETIDESSVGGIDRARTLHQIAYVALRCGEYADAKRFANEVVVIALHEGNYDLAGRAYSVLYELAGCIECDPTEARRYIDLVADNATKSGDVKARTWTLLAALDIEAERGNVLAMRELEEALNRLDVVQNPEGTHDVLLPVEALRSAWHADFARAHRLVAENAEAQPTPDRRGLGFAEVALYAGLLEESRTAIDSADWALMNASETRQTFQAQAYLALAAALSLGIETARLRLKKFHERQLALPNSVDALMRAAQSIVDAWDGNDNHAEVLAALQALEAAHLGGIARLFEALPSPQSPSKVFVK
jgi:hypothetical protein